MDAPIFANGNLHHNLFSSQSTWENLRNFFIADDSNHFIFFMFIAQGVKGESGKSLRSEIGKNQCLH